MDIAHARKFVTYAGFISVLAGLLLVVAQVIWHGHFEGLMKQISGGQAGGWGLQTNVVGFGVMIVGAILLLASIVKSPQITIGEARPDGSRT